MTRAGARPTLADVARAASCSVALVSIVMRDAPGASAATRERVRAVADDLGYVPDQRARKLRQSRSRLIGVTFELQQPFHGDLVERLYAAATARGYDLALSAVAPTRDEHTALEALLRERCEAAVLLGSFLPDDDVARLARRVPMLLLARRSTAPGVGVVRGDDVAGAGLVVDHLVDLGHRHVAYVDGAGAPGSDDRRVGFLAAADRLGVTTTVRTGGRSESDGARATAALLDSPDPPTAIMAFNDRCATGVLHALLHRGLSAPDDVSVVGYDDSRLARTADVALTTVSQSASALADAAVDGAVAMVAGGTPGETVLVPELVVRATTGPPPPP